MSIIQKENDLKQIRLCGQYLKAKKLKKNKDSP
jgi:hypothetical protein